LIYKKSAIAENNSRREGRPIIYELIILMFTHFIYQCCSGELLVGGYVSFLSGLTTHLEDI
jgi:hypothetical protein